MTHVVQILPSITLSIEGGGLVTLNDLQSFIDQAKKMDVPVDKPLATILKAPYHHDQRDQDPGSFHIVAS